MYPQSEAKNPAAESIICEITTENLGFEHFFKATWRAE
jgi:hypothetical protein